MWKGTGRSGIGAQTILGDYDDWDGLSMNGRQWKNRLTKETRDLSGADYWHQRKALEPKMPEDIPTFVNGVANVKGFAEPVAKPKGKPKASVADKIDLAQRHYDRLEKMSQELDEEYFAGEVDEERYELLRFKLDKRLTVAWQRLEKDNAIIWQKQDEKLLTEEQAKAKLQIKEKSDCFLGKTADKSLLSENGWGNLALRDCSNTNVFLIGICGIMKLIKKMKGEI